jgi:Tfp pilus assembly protein FimT
MIVVVVMAIVAVLALPMVGATNKTRLESAARLLIADLGYAQMESIAHPDDPYGVKFDSNAETYTVVHHTSYPPFTCTTASAVNDPTTGQSFVTDFGNGRARGLAGVEISSYSLDSDACIVFGAFGQTDQSTAATVTLISGGTTLTVSIDPTSGEATIP